MTTDNHSLQRSSPKRRPSWLLPLIIGLSVAAALVTLVLVFRPEPAPERSGSLDARLELAAGDVKVDVGAGEYRAASGSALPMSAKLATGRGARALVRLPNGSSVFLRGDTRLELGREAVRLISGEYWLDAPPLERVSLEHRAGEVVVTAADAGLSIAKQGAKVTVYVARGSAAVSGGKGRIEARAGEQVTVSESGEPKRAPVAFWDDWTGGMADFGPSAPLAGAGAGRVYAVDSGAPAGAPVRPLDISKQAVRAVVRAGLSETEVDQTFFNPGERDVEGWYWFTLPEDASITGFAVETDGQLVEGEFTERKEAAAQYGAAKEMGHSPAILEYIDRHSYRARIYPVRAGGTRRIVLRYLQLRPVLDNKIEYVYPMGGGQPVRVGEFSLSVDLGEHGKRMKIATLEDARVEEGGARVTMRRSGYTPRAAFQLEARITDRRSPLTAARYRAGSESADYVLVRYAPDLDWAATPESRADVVVVVDTSAGGDEAAHRLKLATAEAVLRALSDQDRFAVLTLDVTARIAYPPATLANANDQEIARALEALAARAPGGATDFGALFEQSLERLHGTSQPAIIYIGDGLATSGELSPEQLVERLRRSLSASRARFFALAVGTDANTPLLGALARAGGGETLSVDESEHTTGRALELLAAIKTPTITDLNLDLGAGLDEVFVSATGKLSRGQELLLLARTHHELPDKATVKGTLAGKPFQKVYDLAPDKTAATAFVPRLWAAEYVRRLLGEGAGPDAERGRIVKLGTDYGLVTPFTSILALESEAAYDRMGIPRRNSPLRGVRLGALSPAQELGLTLGALPAATAFGCSRQDEKEEGYGTRAVSAAAPAPTPVTLTLETPTAAVDQVDPTSPPPAPAAEPAPTAGPGRARDLASAQEFGSIGVAKGGGAARPSARAAARPDGDALFGLGTDARYQARQEQAAASAPVERRGTGGAAPQAKPAPAKPPATNRGASDQPSETSKPRPHRIVPLHCSDASAQPLAVRALLWWRRLLAANAAAELVERYDSAARACELSDWRAERVFLDLLQRRVRTASDAETILSRFSDRPFVQKFVAKLILRRSIDPALTAAVERALYKPVDWVELDLKLQAIAAPPERLAKLREMLSATPSDPRGSLRLVRALLEAGQRDEALTIGRKLREDGLFTPELTRQLGDVLAAADLPDDAIRTYSEIVEFDARNPASRRLLGDTYLAHGWYEPAYRQYRVLTDENPNDALSSLRLAAAAAGAGRIDEALRIERRVANAEGTPGPDDPRRWARLLSAARIGRLLAGDVPAPERARLERELKELQLWTGPGTLYVLTWENLQVDVVLNVEQGATAVALGDITDAATVGLSAAALGAEPADARWIARRRGPAPTAALPLKLHRLIWDGTTFKVHVQQSVLKPQDVQVALL